MSSKWQTKVREYCKDYDIPIDYIAETLYEPKVVPMIRGKAFEFSVMLRLQKILPLKKWLADKVRMNAQSGLHDIDVRVKNLSTEKIISIECKLASKKSYRSFLDGHSEIRVKCMRSRTLGADKVRSLAPILGVSEAVLMVHNDQYVATDFDVVITSIGNAFYRTNELGLFEWQPTESELKFLEFLNGGKIKHPKDFAFSKMYIARAKDIAITETNQITCTRRGCVENSRCAFIPNYPIIYFDPRDKKPRKPWIPIEEAAQLLASFK